MEPSLARAGHDGRAPCALEKLMIDGEVCRSPTAVQQPRRKERFDDRQRCDIGHKRRHQRALHSPRTARADALPEEKCRGEMHTRRAPPPYRVALGLVSLLALSTVMTPLAIAKPIFIPEQFGGNGQPLEVRPVALTIESPPKDSTQWGSGWRLQLSIRPKFDYGIGHSGHAKYPPYGAPAFFVLQDTD